VLTVVWPDKRLPEGAGAVAAAMKARCLKVLSMAATSPKETAGGQI
jgi:hypothetical protein